MRNSAAARQTKEFFSIFTEGELYRVKGELVILMGYNPTYDVGVFENEDGERIEAGPGLIRLESA